jgi:arsenate reductase
MQQPEDARHVLFLCRDNAALSPMAAALLDHWGRGRFRAWSAGWRPAPGVHAMAARTLRRAELAGALLKPRSWDELGAADAPALRFVILLSHDLPDTPAPAFRGDPMLARWHVGDPAAVAGPPETQERAFDHAFREIEARVKLFASLPLDGLDRLAAERRLAEIEIALAMPAARPGGAFTPAS